MARDPLDDNPPTLDSRREIAAFIKDRGADPMDIRSERDIASSATLLEGMAAGSIDPGNRTERDIALEHERVRSRGMDFGLDIGPLEDIDVDEEWL